MQAIYLYKLLWFIPSGIGIAFSKLDFEGTYSSTMIQYQESSWIFQYEKWTNETWVIRAEDYEWSAVHESGLIDVVTFIASV